MSNRIGIGMASFAFDHAHQCIQEIQDLSNAFIPKIWDDNTDRGEAASKKYDVPYTPKLDEFMNNPEIDCIIIFSETHKHSELISKLVQCGKPILCQKPLSHSLSECDKIIRETRDAGVHCKVAFQMRLDPIHRKAKELVDSGEIGNISVLRRRHGGHWLLDQEFISHPFRSWQFDPNRSLGMFMWEGIHVTDFMLWFLGYPKSVISRMDNVVTETDNDDTGVAVYRFKGGELGIPLSSGTMVAAENSMEIYGDMGTIVQNFGDTVPTRLPPKGTSTALKMFSSSSESKEWQKFDFSNKVSQLDRKRRPARAFVNFILGKEDKLVSALEGRKSVEMLLGAYKANRNDFSIEFPLKDNE